MSRTVSIVEILQRIGVEKVEVQPLLDALTGATGGNDKDTRITFLAPRRLFTPDDAVNKKPRYLPLVVWLPMLDVDRVNAELDARPAQAAPQKGGEG